MGIIASLRRHAFAWPFLAASVHRGVRRAGGEITDEQYLEEVGRTYRGKTVIAHDLDIY